MLALLRLVPIKEWLYIGATLALTIAVNLFVHHERTVGEQKCEARVTAAQADAKKQAADLQTKLDTEAAANDAALRAVVAGTPLIAPILGTHCTLSQSDVDAIRSGLK